MTTTVEIHTADGTTGPVPIGDALFDGTRYQQPVPTLDGHRADTLKVAFGGAVEIDLMIEDDLEWFKTLQFGQEVELRVTAKVAKVGWAHKTGADDAETVTHTLGLAVHSIGTDD